MRLDGTPFADQLSDLTNLNKIWYPVRYTEGGVDLKSVEVMTGTTPTGALAADNCTGWTGVGNYAYGWADAGPADWTIAAGPNTCATANHLYCLGKDRTAPVAPVRPAGKILFLTKGTFTPGTAVGGAAVGMPSANQLCMNERPAGSTSTFVALLDTTTVASGTLLGPTTTYLGVDGQVIGLGSDLRAATMFGSSGIWEYGDGTFPGAKVFAWTGGVPSSVTNTTWSCTNWTSSTPTQGRQGTAATTNLSVLFSSQVVPCTTAASIYCLEQ
jgi:hypothetical protein